MSAALDQHTQQTPINNIFKVPLETYGPFLPCEGNETLIGLGDATFLVEAESKKNAIKQLRTWPGFYKNWNRLPPKLRKINPPFRLKSTSFDETEQVLPCEYRFKNRLNDYTCGIPTNDQFEPDPNAVNGEHGFCCIQKGYHAEHSIPSCPYRQQLVLSGLSDE